MKDLTLFGFDPPLRASALGAFMRCSWRATLLYLELFGDEGGPAAQTGSLTHAAVETWHRDPLKSVEAALSAMATRLPEFPLADKADAERHFNDYAADPRNAQAEVVHVELPVKLTLPPAIEDATGRPVLIKGIIDQVRRVGGRLQAFDLKTGSIQGWDMVNEYAYQISAYACAASETLGEPVQPGALIRTQGYRRRGAPPASQAPEGVFWSIPWDLVACRLLLDGIRSAVARVRNGEPWIGPGSHCRWCPLGGLEGCLPEYKRLVELN